MSDVAVHPSGRVLLSVAKDKRLKMWNLIDAKLIYKQKFDCGSASRCGVARALRPTTAPHRLAARQLVADRQALRADVVQGRADSRPGKRARAHAVAQQRRALHAALCDDAAHARRARRWFAARGAALVVSVLLSVDPVPCRAEPTLFAVTGGESKLVAPAAAAAAAAVDRLVTSRPARQVAVWNCRDGTQLFAMAGHARR